jgi:small subunit ribosomal protein S9
MVIQKRDRVNGDALGTGRRKTSIARVRIRPGKGKIVVNGRPFDEYFTTDKERRQVQETLDRVGQTESVDVMNQDFFQPLRDDGFLTRDSRMKERKKYGLRGARRGVQFSKR